ncbi:S66 peptidase family protein [Crocinitomix catalasitica]|uniref:S66 peptidase family protein n=1 Tax=Crocinitomix catalasitica TaxID=184607 RepID=UPI00047F584A|nr:LD-carboxypeptidase [Crocinitomix catalasitica]
MKTIRIVAPAKAIEADKIAFAHKVLSLNNFNVQLSNNLNGNYHYFSGTLTERLADFQSAIDDKEVDIILCARGGYGCVQLIDQLDFTQFIQHPKLIIGYSDVTVFHQHVYGNFNIPTVHASAPLNFEDNSMDSLSSLINVFNEKVNTYEFPAHQLNITGSLNGEVIGGNLAVICALIGTNSDFDFTEKILFIEDIGEAVYSIDRMMYTLKKAGKLDGIKGLIVGGMTNMKDSAVPYGESVEQIIHHHIKPFKIPLCFNFPAGHIDDNRAIIIGKKAIIKIGDDKVIFEQ